jgi:hypothetical protein
MECVVVPKAFKSKLALDDEIIAFLSRVGMATDTAYYVTGYTVTRDVNNITLISVTLIADDKFSVEAGNES